MSSAASSTPLTHYRSCHLCEAMCGIVIEHDGERVLSIRGDKDDPLSHGHICPKAIALQDIHTDPDRLRYPMRRTAEGWEQMEWKEAFDYVGERILAIIKEHGNDAVGVYLGNPNVHNYGSLLYGLPLLRSLRTKHRFSATSLDQLPHMFVSSLMFGHQLVLPIPDVDRTDFFVIMGGNPLVSNGSIMSVPNIKKRLKAIQERGGKVVVIDPRRTETADVADQHIFVRPGSDAVLLLAVLEVLASEGLADCKHLAPFLTEDEREAFWTAVRGVTPEEAEAVTGVSSDAIRTLARDFAAAKTAVWYGRLGVSVQQFGGVCQWLINAINIVTGRLDQPGGPMFPQPGMDVVSQKLIGRGKRARWHSRVRNLPEFGGELPVAVLAEEILTPGPGQIRAMVTSAGNPVLSSPNGRQLDRAFEQLDFMVAVDIYINETTRHADVILPPTTGLEHDHFDLIFHHFAVRNTIRYSPALFKGAPHTKHDWEILLELETRINASKGVTSALKAWGKRAVMKRLGPAGLLDLGLRTGPYKKQKEGRPALSLRALKKAPHGIDLGPLRPCLDTRLCTKDKNIRLAPECLVAELSAVRTQIATFAAEGSLVPQESTPEAARDGVPFLLIGRRHLRSNNSWMHNSERLMRGKDRCTMLLHPEDGEAHGFADGGQVTIVSRVGELTCAVEWSDEIMPGVVSVPHGWGHQRKGVKLQVAANQPGVSVNDLTDELAVDAVCGTSVLNGVPVWLKAVDDA